VLFGCLDEVDCRYGQAIRLFAEHRVAIKELPDVRQQEFEDIRAMATDPQQGTLRRPRTRIVGFSIEVDGEVVPAPLATWHLMSDEDGMFPLTSLNTWERSVVKAELARPNVCGWYRNPSRAALDSLGIAYRDDSGNWRSMHPDFVFFHQVKGEIRASIVDPHGLHLDDADIKLRSLARFAIDFGAHFHRIEAVAEVDGHMRIIDMQIAPVCSAVLASKQSAVDIYRSNIAVDYDVAGPG
jgi:type III restriction enzyme